MPQTPPQTDTYNTALDIFDRTHPLRVDVDENLKVVGTVTTIPSGTQTVAIDQTGNNNHVDVTNFPVVQNVTVVPAADFDYVTGSLTASGSIVGFGNCEGIRVFANGVDSKFAINGGAPITVRSNQTFYHIPQGELLNPVIDWFAGSIDVWMEVEGALPPSIADLGLSLGIAHL